MAESNAERGVKEATTSEKSFVIINIIQQNWITFCQDTKGEREIKVTKGSAIERERENILAYKYNKKPHLFHSLRERQKSPVPHKFRNHHQARSKNHSGSTRKYNCICARALFFIVVRAIERHTAFQKFIHASCRENHPAAEGVNERNRLGAAPWSSDIGQIYGILGYNLYLVSYLVRGGAH